MNRIATAIATTTISSSTIDSKNGSIVVVICIGGEYFLDDLGEGKRPH